MTLTEHPSDHPGAPTARVVPPDAEGDVSVLTLVNVLLRQRWLIAGCAFVLFAAVVGAGLLRDRVYTATAAFMPQERRGSSSLSGLASQLGINVPISDGSQPPQFYVDLLRSREILKAVLETEFEATTQAGVARGTLLDIYDLKETTPALRREEALIRLSRQIEAEASAKTGVIYLAVATTDAALSAQIADRLLELVNEFNMRHRRSQASAERQFTERRLAEVRADLLAAENRLQAFLQQNRDIRAPSLRFEEDRRTREVGMQTQLYTTLAQAYEQAKIEEVRDTPVISIIESPEPPVRPSPRGLVVKGLIALFLGTVAGSLLAFARDFVGSPSPGRRGEVAEFRRLRRETLRDLTQPWRPLGRALGARRTRTAG